MDALQSELVAPPELGAAASERAALSYAKPQRPGRLGAQTRVKKFEGSTPIEEI